MLLPVPLSPGGCCSVGSVGEAGQVRPGQGTSGSETGPGGRTREKFPCKTQVTYEGEVG